MSDHSEHVKDLIIIGAGAFGREMLWFIDALNCPSSKWNIIGFVDDTPEKQGTYVMGYPVLGTIDSLGEWPSIVYVTCPIGSSRGRRSIVERLSSFGHIRFANLIAPQTMPPQNLSLGQGIIIYPGTVITSNVTIGSHCVVNIGATLSHDTLLESYVTISPGVTVCGSVHIGSGCEIGAGATIIERRTIATGVIVGAGAVVVRDLSVKGTYVGVPTRLIHD